MATSLFTTAPAFRKGMLALATTLFDGREVEVIAGPPAGAYLPDDIVQIQHVELEQAIATMGSSRGREETLSLDVLVSCATGGGPEVDDELTEHAYGLLSELEFACRITDTTLGGVVRQCFLTAARSQGAGPDETADGRYIEITATFQAMARVRGY